MKYTILRTDVATRNGNIYPREVMEKEIQRLQSEISAKRFLVMQGPQSTEQVDLSKVVGVVTDMVLEGDEVKIDVQILKLPVANEIVDGLQSGKLSVRPNGVGTISKENDDTRIVENYTMTSVSTTDDPA